MISFYAYVDKKKVKKLGIDIGILTNPYKFFNSGLGRGDYAVFPINADPDFLKKYDEDPGFKKIIVSGN